MKENEQKQEDETVKPKKDYASVQPKYSKKEELLNVLTHAFGAVVCFVFGVLMMLKVTEDVCAGIYGGAAVFSVAAFSVALVALYAMSSAYHASRHGTRLRSVLRRFDYCSISFLIAGSYMPYLIIGLVERGNGTSDTVWGIVIAALVGTLAITVIVLSCISVQKFHTFNLIAYVVMGWSIVLRIYHLFVNIGWQAMVLLFSGGLVYTAGILFYKLKKIPYNHAIWHLFVLGGSVLMICGVYFYML